MSELSTKSKQRLELLDGCEVQSIKHENCVSIRRNKVYGNGEMLETLDSNKKVNYLWRAYLKQEGI